MTANTILNTQTQYQLYPANQRGTKDLGWLKSHLTFSFSDYAQPTKAGFGLLRVFNDDVVEAGRGFGLHAHYNMEIISIILEGKLQHKDTMGYDNVLGAGGVQVMSAGKGIRHEEWNVGETATHFLQIWIEPKLMNVEQRYQYRNFPKAQRVNKLVTIVSSEEGKRHCWVNQNVKLSLGYYKDSDTIDYRFDPTNKCIFLFVINGDIEWNEQELKARDAVGIWKTDQITFDVTAETEFLLMEIPINH